MLVRDTGIETQEGCIPGLRGVTRNLKRSSMVRCQNWHLHFSVLSVLEIARHVGVPLRVALHATFEPVRLTIGHAADQEAVDSTSRRRLSMHFGSSHRQRRRDALEVPERLPPAGDHDDGVVRNTARTARSAKTSGGSGRVCSQGASSFSSRTPSCSGRMPPVRIGVRITPGQRTETRTPWRSASIRNVLESATTACLVAHSSPRRRWRQAGHRSGVHDVSGALRDHQRIRGLDAMHHARRFTSKTSFQSSSGRSRPRRRRQCRRC